MSAMRLDTLLEGLATVEVGAERVVEGLCLDSRRVRPGDAFIALAGASSHGLDHAASALAAGAVVVIYDSPAPAGRTVPAGSIGVPALRTRLGWLIDRFYDRPSASLTVVGITGTNGKTSSVQLLAQALQLGGQVAGSIGTLGAGLHGRLQPGERTTPDVVAVHALLAGLRDEGATHVAMEVSSHALDQGRVDGVRFAVAGFTNLTRDHLDYHPDMAAYGEAKAKLFRAPGLRAAVVNLDDAHGRAIHAALPGTIRRIGLSSRGEDGAVLNAARVALSAAGIGFELRCGEEACAVASPLLGRFNADNLLMVAGCLLALGWSLGRIADVLPRLAPVPGRMSRLGGERGLPLVVVDYAHTPDALAQALANLRAHAAARLVCVFGCGGERDAGKRPEMAAIAEAGADRVIVTDDNPRGEDGDRIVAGIIAGFRDPAAATVERDRARAIRIAVGEAGPDDIVLIAGKGHEAYQEVRGVRHPFDDLDVARHALEARA